MSMSTGELAIVISLGSILVAIAVAWGQLRTTQSYHAERITALEKGREENRARLEGLDKKVERLLTMMESMLNCEPEQGEPRRKHA